MHLLQYFIFLERLVMSPNVYNTSIKEQEKIGSSAHERIKRI